MIKLLIMIVGTLLFVTFLFLLITKKYVNPYKLHMYIGRKGSGKSTLAHKKMFKQMIKGKSVWSNMDFEFDYKGQHYSTIPLEPNKIDMYVNLENAYIHIDEVNTYWDNRNFRDMPSEVIMWFRYQRHQRCAVYLYSQTFDIDKKLRTLVDEFHVVNKYARVFTLSRRLIMKPVVVHPEGDAPARIADDFIEDTPLFALFGGLELVWLPRWVKKFDSFSKFKSSRSSDVDASKETVSLSAKRLVGLDNAAL